MDSVFFFTQLCRQITTSQVADKRDEAEFPFFAFYGNIVDSLFDIAKEINNKSKKKEQLWNDK